MRRFLFMIPVLGSSLLWAEEMPVAVREASPVQPSAAEEGGKPELPVPGDRPKAKKGMKGEGAEGERHGPRGLFWKDMNDSQRERLLYNHHLIMKKYDLNRNGVLEPEEMEALKKDAGRFRKERHQFILKKFDKNGDGKLDEEERKAMRDEIRAHIEKRLQERREGKKGDDDDMLPPVPSMRGEHGGRFPGAGGKERKKEGDPARAGADGKKKAGPENGRDSRGEDHPKGKRGSERGRGWGPEGMIMSMGFHLMMEKFDKDKDGLLSQEERKAYDADRAKFGRWLNVQRKKLKDEGRLEEVEKNPPPIMAPHRKKDSFEKADSREGKDREKSGPAE